MQQENSQRKQEMRDYFVSSLALSLEQQEGEEQLVETLAGAGLVGFDLHQMRAMYEQAVEEATEEGEQEIAAPSWETLSPQVQAEE